MGRFLQYSPEETGNELVIGTGVPQPWDIARATVNYYTLHLFMGHA